MNLAKALKTKSRYAHKIASLQNDIQQYNSIPDGQERKINVDKMMEDLDKSVHNLIVLKILIFEASAPMRETILTLAETKSRITFLRGIDTHEGKGKENDYSSGRRFVDSDVDFVTAFDITWVREQVEICERLIDRLQDELDVFNHKTEIEI
jgi:hypothetical protein